MGRKTAIYLMSALLAAVVLVCGVLSLDYDRALPFSFLAVTSGGIEEVKFWDRGDGECFVFVPGYVDLEKLHFVSPNTVWVDGQRMRFGKSCASFQLDQPYPLSGAEGLRTLTFKKSENLATLYMDTESGTMDHIHENKENTEPGTIRLYDPAGKLNYRGKLERIKGRGNSTFTQSIGKKPYGVKLAEKGDLLGMGAAKNWVLLANYFDDSHLKNKLIYDFAAAAGLQFSPESRWVDLYLNGNYAGLYLLCEKNEIDPQRVSISETASFLISKDKGDRLAAQGIPRFVTEAGVPLRIYSNTIGEKNMTDLIQSVETAILSSSGRDPRTGKEWKELIDMDSWVRKYLVEEIFGGGDAGHYSQYFYYEGDGSEGQVFAGPVWDYDITMGVDREPANVFYAHREYISPWFARLYYKGSFQNRLTELYREEFSPLLETLVEKTLPEAMAAIHTAAAMDDLRWWGSGDQEALRMQEYMRERMEFLNRVWIEKDPFYEVKVVNPGQYEPYALVYALAQGMTLEELVDSEYEWVLEEWGEPLDLTEPVYQDMIIYAKEKE